MSRDVNTKNPDVNNSDLETCNGYNRNSHCTFQGLHTDMNVSTFQLLHKQ